ncbi:MAG TPA: serine protease [Thermoanaerobaculia bacterium]|jgi:hypothetical protein|nr:serine protease [Thermoanaerobaculia bacterium]
MSDWDAMWQSVEAAIGAEDADAEARAIVAIQDRIREGENMPPDMCCRGFALLRSNKRFSRLVEFGDLGGFESDAPLARKLAIQGLIETAQFDRAIRELEKTSAHIDRLLAEVQAEGSLAQAEIRLQLRPERAEVRGLLGRVYTQRCVDGAKLGRSQAACAKDALASADHYYKAYREAPIENLWHGINYVAIARYARKNLQVQFPEASPEEVATGILRDLAYLESLDRMAIWDYATRGEAALALGNVAQAKQSYQLYLSHPKMNQFMRASSRRQLVELWQLPETHELVQLFDHAGVPERRPVIATQVRPQARFLDSRYADVKNHPKARMWARTVARLGSTLFVGDGTGFLFDGAAISKKLEGKPLLLTCAHVCPDAVPADRIRTMFFGPGQDDERHVIVEYAELLWTSPDLDASLLLLGAAPYGLKLAPVAKKAVKVGDIAIIIGHPMGGAKLASLENNEVREIEDTRLYYLSATDPGSSGSPVFNAAWQLIGIHRAGIDEKKLNQGSRMDLIVTALREHKW